VLLYAELQIDPRFGCSLSSLLAIIYWLYLMLEAFELTTDACHVKL